MEMPMVSIESVARVLKQSYASVMNSISSICEDCEQKYGELVQKHEVKGEMLDCIPLFVYYMLLAQEHNIILAEAIICLIEEQEDEVLEQMFDMETYVNPVIYH